jgi:hypothetical protein
MNKSLSDLYTQVVLNEAEKHQLQNPGSDEVGNLKSKQDLFGSKPKAVEGPDKAKLQKGPAYKETTGSASAPKSSNKSMGGNSAPAKSPSVDKGEEMEDTEVDPTDNDDADTENDKKKFKPKEESYNMSAFETLFRKTITEEADPIEGEVGAEPAPDMGSEDAIEGMEDEGGEEELEQEEGDLISDLKDLHDRLGEILSKLEGIQEEEESMEEGEGDEYSEGDFDEEFGGEEGEEEEAPMKESVDKMKALGDKKKVLQGKKNKVGKLSAKGGKAHTGNIKTQPSPSALGDKKKHLQSKSNQVKSSVKKGEFIK